MTGKICEKEGMLCEKEKCNPKTQAGIYYRRKREQGAVSVDAAFHHYFPAVYLLPDVRSDHCVQELHSGGWNLWQRMGGNEKLYSVF